VTKVYRSILVLFQACTLLDIGLKLSVGAVFTSKQYRWSPNFSRTIQRVTPSESVGKCL